MFQLYHKIESLSRAKKSIHPTSHEVGFLENTSVIKDGVPAIHVGTLAVEKAQCISLLSGFVADDEVIAFSESKYHEKSGERNQDETIIVLSSGAYIGNEETNEDEVSLFHYEIPYETRIELQNNGWKMTLEQAKEIIEFNGGDLVVPPETVSLPEGLEVEGNLLMAGSRRLESLPKDLSVKGSIFAWWSALKALPEGLTVGEDVDISYSSVAYIPESVKIGGGLYAPKTKIEYMPGIHIPGDVDISNTPFKRFSDKFTIGRSLFACSVQFETPLPAFHITEDVLLDYSSLPFGIADGFTVDGGLSMRYTNIDKLPDGIKAAMIDAPGSSLTQLPDHLYVEGDVLLRGSGLKKIPEYFEVGGNLDISVTKVATVPPNLKVGERFNFAYTEIKTVPIEAEYGSLIARGSALEAIPPKDISGELNITETGITEIPLIKIGELYARDTHFTEQIPAIEIKTSAHFERAIFDKGISEDISIGEYMYIGSTEISSIPEEIKVIENGFYRGPYNDEEYIEEEEEEHTEEDEEEIDDDDGNR